MKIAIQLAGGLRSFRHCWPRQLESLGFYQHPEDFDIIALIDTSPNQNWSEANEALFRDMCRGRLIILEHCSAEKDKLFINPHLSDIVRRAHDEFGVCIDSFIHKLWARRYQVNELRKKTGRDYDLVVRIRPDLVVIASYDNHIKGSTQSTYPDMAWSLIYDQVLSSKQVYLQPDVLAIGTPEMIDIESRLGIHYPLFDVNIWPEAQDSKINSLKRCFFPSGHYDQSIIKWTYASEAQNVCMFWKNGINVLDLDLRMTIDQDRNINDQTPYLIKQFPLRRNEIAIYLHISDVSKLTNMLSKFQNITKRGYDLYIQSNHQIEINDVKIYPLNVPHIDILNQLIDQGYRYLLKLSDHNSIENLLYLIDNVHAVSYNLQFMEGHPHITMIVSQSVLQNFEDMAFWANLRCFNMDTFILDNRVYLHQNKMLTQL